jgi:hypothetical protein
MSIDVCRMRVLAHGLLFLSMEATSFNQQRSAAIAVIEAAIKFMRSIGEKDVQIPCDGVSDCEKSTPLTGEVCASVVAHLNSQQLLLLVEELLAMLARDPRVGWQHAVLATSHTLCSHIKSEPDAVRVLLLLLYPPPSIDSFVMVDACFVQLLSVCPQVQPPPPPLPSRHSGIINTTHLSIFFGRNFTRREARPRVAPTRDAGVQPAPCHPNGGARRKRNGHSQSPARHCC